MAEERDKQGPFAVQGVAVARPAGVAVARPGVLPTTSDEADEMDPEAVAELTKRAKKALRQRARALRNTVPAAAIAERSAKIVRRLVALDVIQTARSVASFVAMQQRHEVDLATLHPQLRERGADVSYPAVDVPNRHMRFLIENDFSRVVPQGAPYAEPPPDAPEAETLDVIVVPALLIDGRGHRLGYGGGFYDRTIPRYRPPAVAVGVCFEFQLAADLPMTSQDETLDIVVTDERVLHVKVPA